MNRFLCLALVALLWPAVVAGVELPEIVLWPEGMPEPVVPADPVEVNELGADGISRRSNVSRPRLIVHRPAKDVKTSGAAVIVVPGGGFGKLADGHEGAEACQWLAGQGIVAFQLVHRTPTNKHAEPHAGPVQDLQKAMIEVRRRAGEFGVDPKQIGVLGFSAGGQVTLIAATNGPAFSSSSGSDKISSKPDFLLLLYAWKIFDPETKALRREIQLDAGLPPTFIAQMGDDAGSLPQGSTLLYLELIKRKIPAEIHIYEKGGHGFGMRSRAGATGPSDWQNRASDWLRLHGYVGAK